MKQAVVLCCGDGKFEYLADKKRCDRAAASALTFQIRNTRNGHIVGKVQSLKPVRIAIENSGAKAHGPVSSAVAIDFHSALQEQLPIAEQTAIMIQVMDVYFKTAVADVLQERVRNWIFSLRYDFEAGFYPPSVIHIHQARAVISPG